MPQGFRQGTASAVPKVVVKESGFSRRGMSIPKRHGSAPGTYFVTSRTWEGHAIFQTPATCEIFIESLLGYRERGAYKLHGFVLMPDHFHALLTPGDTYSLERVLQFIKGGSARKINESLHLKSPVWQRGFSDHRIRDTADYTAHLQYLIQNPVKRHLATDANGYPRSSASGAFRMDEIPQGLKPLTLVWRFGTAEAVP
jgi:putative transposase